MGIVSGIDPNAQETVVNVHKPRATIQRTRLEQRLNL